MMADPNEFLPFCTSMATFGIVTLFSEAPCQLARAIKVSNSSEN